MSIQRNQVRPTHPLVRCGASALAGAGLLALSLTAGACDQEESPGDPAPAPTESSDQPAAGEVPDEPESEPMGEQPADPAATGDSELDELEEELDDLERDVATEAERSYGNDDADAGF